MTVYNQANDPYFQGGELTACRTAVTLTKSDTVDEALYPKQTMVLSAGNIVCLPLKNVEGNFLTFTGVIAGQILPIRVRRINNTGTTATVAGLFD
jgi:hypothetical protein